MADAKSMRPEVLSPYHYGNTDTAKLVDLLKDEKGIQVRIRNLSSDLQFKNPNSSSRFFWNSEIGS